MMSERIAHSPSPDAVPPIPQSTEDSSYDKHSANSNEITTFGKWMSNLLIDDIKQMANMFRTKYNKYHLSWIDDFFSLELMSIPKKSEFFMRLNLNVPYYFLNYALLIIIGTFPTLLFLNIPYFVVLVANVFCCFRIFFASLSSPNEGKSCIKIHRWYVPFAYVGHFFVLLWLIIFFFFDGIRTGFYIITLNCILVFPHALLRKPTFFDDEEMEKLRPKLLDYLLMLAFILLAYLEGDSSGLEDENLRRSLEERERINVILFKKNDTGEEPRKSVRTKKKAQKE